MPGNYDFSINHTQIMTSGQSKRRIGREQKHEVRQPMAVRKQFPS